jgi:hypothetical protein
MSSDFMNGEEEYCFLLRCRRRRHLFIVVSVYHWQIFISIYIYMYILPLNVKESRLVLFCSVLCYTRLTVTVTVSSVSWSRLYVHCYRW